ncbi:MAG: hypothetical protein RR182_09390, partial [Alistipes sp.]
MAKCIALGVGGGGAKPIEGTLSFSGTTVTISFNALDFENGQSYLIKVIYNVNYGSSLDYHIIGGIEAWNDRVQRNIIDFYWGVRTNTAAQKCPTTFSFANGVYSIKC